MKKILKIDQLSKSFEKEKYVLKNINLAITKGTIIAIVGESGSGKTSLSRLIAGLETPNCGNILINNKIVNSDSIFIPPNKRNVGMLFQDYALFPHLTVAKNIEYGISKSLNKKERIKKVLELVSLTEFEQRYPHQISGGQQQRVALARAIAPNPQILILDEPFSNLDGILRLKLRNEIFSILKETKITTIFITHDTEDAMAVANEIILLQNGEIIQKGASYELFTKPINTYVASLFGKINTLTSEDLSYFNFNSNPDFKYVVRLHNFEINKKTEYNTSTKVISSTFLGDYYINTSKLPNGKTIHFYTSINYENTSVILGFNSDKLLKMIS